MNLETIEKAEEAYNARNYSTSLAHYRTILQEEPNRIHALYYAAESARRLRSYKLAERYFEDIPNTEKKEFAENFKVKANSQD